MSRRPRSPGPGFINMRLDRRRAGATSCATILARGRRLRPLDDRQGRARSTSNMSRPTRPGRCTWAIAAARWSATRWRGLLEAAGHRVTANIMSTTPARRSIRSPARRTCATARRWARRSARSPKALSGRLSDPGRRSCSPPNLATATPARRRANGCQLFRRRPVAAMIDLIRARSRAARHPSRHVRVRGRAAGAGARRPRRWRAARQGAGLSKACSSAQEPDEHDDWEPVELTAVPLDPVRRRPGPADEEVGRQLDLFRRRRRLSLAEGRAAPTI